MRHITSEVLTLIEEIPGPTGAISAHYRTGKA
jgi:hypothetical protein